MWVAELESDYGEERGGIFNVCLILEFEDGRIKRETRYYADAVRQRPRSGRSGRSQAES